MTSDKKNNAKKIAKTGARSVGGLITLIIKIIGTLLLIGVTTSLIFSCIFAVYVKTNLTSGLDISLKDQAQKESSVIYIKDPATGSEEKIVIQSSVYRKWIGYDLIPQDAEHALVAIEDKRFYDHNGVDWYRTFGAFVNMFLSMKDNFGGSTITQQLIKNLTGEDEVTVQRKLQEIFTALQFEQDYDKDEIVEWYLNVVYFGANCYGLEAAADYYFGKSASELTLAECASIIGITNNPSKYNPYINAEANKSRQIDILTEMYKQGYIASERAFEEAKNQKLDFKRGEGEKGTAVVYSWFIDAVIEDVINDLMAVKGISKRAAEDILFYQGLRINCTMDPTMQAKVDSIYQDREAMPKVGGSTEEIQSAIVIADPYTGHILAMEGGVGEKTGNRLFNRATQMHRPPGSSIKPLAAYAPGIEFGVITPETRFEDSADVTLTGTDWMPKNDDFKFSGVINIRSALIASKNTIAAQIIDQLTPAKSYNFLVDKLGFDLNPFDSDYAPMALGQLTNGITVREMASGYTMFDNNGVEMRLITYSEIYDSEGNLYYENKPVTSVAIRDVTAYWVTDMLQDAATFGTGYEANLGNLMPVAGKTGTTTDKKDRWFAGYTPYYVAVVWTGFDTPAPMKVTGNPSAQTWKKVMKLVHEGLDYKEFTTPPDTYLTPIPGVDAEVPYIKRGINILDDSLLYEFEETAIKGKNITVTADPQDGFEIVGSPEKTITITDNPENNVFEFYYQPIVPSPPIDPTEEPTEEPTGEPTEEPTSDPTTSPSPPPTTSPSPSHTPTTSPSPSPSHSPSQ